MIARVNGRAQRGFTLIELMVAMALGLIVAAGIITVFASTSHSNRAQTQLASLQEAGRFAVTKIKDDARMANGQYCTNTGGVAKAAPTSQVFLDGLRSPKIYTTGITAAMSDVTTGWAAASGNTYPDEPAAAYSFPSYLSMRGYDCDKTTCLPVDPHTSVAAIPAMGKAVDDRVVGADVITLRYVNSSRGWAVVSTGVTGTHLAVAASSPNEIQSITLAQATSAEPPIADFVSGDIAMLADCSNAQVFAVTMAGAVLTPDASKNFITPAPQQPLSAPKVFDFNRDYQTVTYYLRVVDSGNGKTTGALIRRVNGGAVGAGGSEDELVRGVERMDFRYGVEDAKGEVRYMTANDVDKATSITCPPSEPNAITTVGCLWRAVSSIEINLVIDGQVPLYTLTAPELTYSYGIDGDNTPTAPTSHTIQPFTDQGFPNEMIRREFTTVVSVRNFNP